MLPAETRLSHTRIGAARGSARRGAPSGRAGHGNGCAKSWYAPRPSARLSSHLANQRVLATPSDVRSNSAETNGGRYVRVGVAWMSLDTALVRRRSSPALRARRRAPSGRRAPRWRGTLLVPPRQRGALLVPPRASAAHCTRFPRRIVERRPGVEPRASAAHCSSPPTQRRRAPARRIARPPALSRHRARRWCEVSGRFRIRGGRRGRFRRGRCRRLR